MANPIVGVSCLTHRSPEGTSLKSKGDVKTTGHLGTKAMYSDRFEVLEPPSPLGKGPTFLDVWQAISSTEKKTAI